ncbi:unnamed protein product [Candidula unifasciata]|uniref:Uncharacterized protein n=1 Tax=Candidula unifasciata TaxID=100452 RepID=A0A8S3ZGW6_9EUPU|nr:unnamed protein product [Candidula unifasciata]
MSKLCAKCGKPVYFAERKTSLGKEWHPNCLKCIACGKVLSPGQHAEYLSFIFRREILEKIKDFNKYYEGKVHHQMTAHEKEDGSVHVEGPLRIYWGLSRPIQLVHCDNIPPAPISQWRHSLCVGPESPDIPEKRFSTSFRRSGSPTRKSRELDDILTPSSPDDVVRRQKKVRKFKTVAYRGDQPTKWKRASINGHVFNFDTSVFTPVLGSCTSVTVDGTLNCSDVIETLLDKFKVQNSPDEYVLSVVTEEGERLLTHSDKPYCFACPQVEQLLVLPEAVLRGILAKYYNDEEKEVTLVKARYETARRRMEKRLRDMQSHQTSSTA